MKPRFKDVDPKRSTLMARIKSTQTQPELTVRRSLHRRGFRFRLHRRDLPGKPDIVLPKYKLVILVHGCFWHQHSNCKLASRPKSRGDYWGPKLAANVARDKRNVRSLEQLGWCVEIVWECETRDGKLLEKALDDICGVLR